MQGNLRREPAEIIYSARMAMGESQRVFAARLDTRQSLISKYENKRVSPPADLLIQCVNLLDGPSEDVSTEDLVVLVKQRLNGGRMRQARQAVAQMIRCVGTPSHRK
jgi:transcriptional regulator with XRE-family HTH domain